MPDNDPDRLSPNEVIASADGLANREWRALMRLLAASRHRSRTLVVFVFAFHMASGKVDWPETATYSVALLQELTHDGKTKPGEEDLRHTARAIYPEWSRIHRRYDSLWLENLLLAAWGYEQEPTSPNAVLIIPYRATAAAVLAHRQGIDPRDLRPQVAKVITHTWRRARARELRQALPDAPDA